MADFEVVEHGLEVSDSSGDVTYGVVTGSETSLYIVPDALVLGLIVGGVRGLRFVAGGELSLVIGWKDQEKPGVRLQLTDLEHSLSDRNERLGRATPVLYDNDREFTAAEARTELERLHDAYRNAHLIRQKLVADVDTQSDQTPSMA